MFDQIISYIYWIIYEIRGLLWWLLINYWWLLIPICIAGLLCVSRRKIGISRGLFLTIVLAAAYLMFLSVRFGKEMMLDWKSLGLLLGIVGLIYKPIVDSLSDKDFNDFDYISLGLSLVLGIALIGSVAYLVTPFDSFLRATFTLPFAGLGIALILLPFIYYRYRGAYEKQIARIHKKQLARNTNSGNDRYSPSNTKHRTRNSNSNSSSRSNNNSKRKRRRKKK